MQQAQTGSARKKSWIWTALALVGGCVLYSRAKRNRTPKEIAPMPRDRALDREKNIEYLRENYPEREYEPPSKPAAQPNPTQKPIEKDEAPLHGFHGG
jgi:hypothetical protein